MKFQGIGETSPLLSCKAPQQRPSANPRPYTLNSSASPALTQDRQKSISSPLLPLEYYRHCLPPPPPPPSQVSSVNLEELEHRMLEATAVHVDLVHQNAREALPGGKRLDFLIRARLLLAKLVAAVGDTYRVSSETPVNWNRSGSRGRRVGHGWRRRR